MKNIKLVKQSVISQEVQIPDNHSRVSVNLHASSKTLVRKSLNLTVCKANFFDVRKSRFRACFLEVENRTAPKSPLHLSYLNPHCLRLVRTNVIDGSVGALPHCYSRWCFHYSTSKLQKNSKSYMGHTGKSVDLENPRRKVEET